MWNPDTEPTLSLPDMARTLGMSVRATKEMVEENLRRKQARARQLELKAAERRHKQGPRRVNEELGDAVPEFSVAKLSWLLIHRASMNQKDCKGGEFWEDDDFVRFYLKRNEHARVQLACAVNRVGWLPTVENAKHAGETERGRAALLDHTGGLPA